MTLTLRKELNIECLMYTRHCVRCFMCTISLKTHILVRLIYPHAHERTEFRRTYLPLVTRSLCLKPEPVSLALHHAASLDAPST